MARRRLSEARAGWSWRGVRVAVGAATLLGMAASIVGVPGRTPVAAAEGTGHIIFGIHPSPGTQQEIQSVEASIGRQFASVREFDRWDSTFPTSLDLWMRDSGHTLFLSVQARWKDGTPIPWRSIADSVPGSAIYNKLVSWADRIRNYAVPLYFMFSPEPEMYRNADLGSNTDFIDAWRLVRGIFRSEGATNAQFVWTMTDQAFSITDYRAAALWYPGDTYIDAIGADAYNWYNCKADFPNGPWRSFYYIVNPVRLFGVNHPGIPLMLPEFGTVEDPAVPGRKAQWIQDMQTTMESPGWESFTHVSNFNTTDPYNTACHFRMDSSASSLAAFSAMGADPYFSAVASPPNDTTTPTTPGAPGGVSNDPGSIALTWSGSTDPDDATLTYRVYRDGGSTAVGSVSSSAGTVMFTDTGLSPGSTHTYTVTASDEVNTSPPSPSSAPITVQSAVFADGFESGNLSKWTRSVGITASNQDAFAGSWSALAASTGSTLAYAQKTLPSTYSDLYALAHVKVVSQGTKSVNLLRVTSATGTPIVTVLRASAGNLEVWKDSQAVLVYNPTILTAGAWHTVEMRVVTGTGAKVEVWLDGVKQAKLSVALPTTGPAAGALILGDNVSGRTYQVRFDDVAVSTAFMG